MINKKKCSIGLITAILLLSFVSSTFSVQAYSLRTVYGMVYIDGETAPDGTTVKLSFTDQEFTNETFREGDYAMTFLEDNYEEGTFSVYYQGVWYPTVPPTVELGDQHEILYNVDLYVTLPPNNPPDAPFNPLPEDNEENVSLDTTLSVTVTDPDEDPMLVSFYNASDDTLIDYVEDVPSGGTAAINWIELEYNTTYCWYAVANDGEFDTQSDTWCFTTVEEGQENNPPDAPFNPTPEDNEENVSLDTTLSVTVTDPDDDPMLVSFYNASDDTLIDYVEDVPSGGEAAINWIGLEYNTTYCWYAVANDEEFDTQSDTWCFTTIEEGQENNPPDAPITPNPSDGATGTETIVTLSVYVTDPDSDPLDVNFYDASDDSPIDIDTGVASGTTASVPWNGLSYSTTYSWYVVADDSEYTTKSDTWSFTTGASGGGGGGGDGLPPNIPPIADASAGEPYIGFIGEDITFDGSDSYDPDGGYIISWHWDFDDGTDGYGEKITHNYSSVGAYHVTLTVTDDNSGTDTETFDVVISIANNAPEDLEVDGPLTGDQNTDYDYTASATDPDEDDMLRFIFEWGDGTTTTSDVVASGVIATVTHNWSKYGVFEVTVRAVDNYSSEISTTFTVLIDVIVVEGDITGLIIDEDGSDPYDIFNNTDTDGETEVELDNGSYLIDSDGDGKWDYAYDPDTGLITYYDFVYDKFFVIYEAKNTPGFELLTLLVAIGILAILLRKKKIT